MRLAAPAPMVPKWETAVASQLRGRGSLTSPLGERSTRSVG